MAVEVIGPCLLCGSVRRLVKSHPFPAGIFRKLRNPSYSNPNPILISGGRLFQTSKQPTARLLCEHCEDRFNRNGEKWVMENCYQRDGRFRLRDLLFGAPSATGPAGAVVCATAGLPGIEANQLAYFAASIFWRASIYKPKFDTVENRVSLGARYEEGLRAYLLGLSDLPPDMGIIVVVSPAPNFARAVWAPSGQWFGRVLGCRFSVPGIMFDLYAGETFEIPIQKLCIYRSPHKPIFLSDRVEQFLYEAIRTVGARRTASLG